MLLPARGAADYRVAVEHLDHPALEDPLGGLVTLALVGPEGLLVVREILSFLPALLQFLEDLPLDPVLPGLLGILVLPETELLLFGLPLEADVPFLVFFGKKIIEGPGVAGGDHDLVDVFSPEEDYAQIPAVIVPPDVAQPDFPVEDEIPEEVSGLLPIFLVRLGGVDVLQADAVFLPGSGETGYGVAVVHLDDGAFPVPPVGPGGPARLAVPVRRVRFVHSVPPSDELGPRREDAAGPFPGILKNARAFVNFFREFPRRLRDPNDSPPRPGPRGGASGGGARGLSPGRTPRFRVPAGKLCEAIAIIPRGGWVFIHFVLVCKEYGRGPAEKIPPRRARGRLSRRGPRAVSRSDELRKNPGGSRPYKKRMPGAPRPDG